MFIYEIPWLQKKQQFRARTKMTVFDGQTNQHLLKRKATIESVAFCEG